jgi:hypothetical protein
MTPSPISLVIISAKRAQPHCLRQPDRAGEIEENIAEAELAEGLSPTNRDHVALRP